MNTLHDNDWTRGWRRLGKTMPRPKGIVCISAHWYLPALLVGAMPQPRTIHDFGGFPRELFAYQYPAPGDPGLAARVKKLLTADSVQEDKDRWGLDHGAWSVLCHVYPNADIPVVQLSIHEEQSTQWHFETAKKLAPLRDEGILIVGSGNIVHNLHTYAWGNIAQEPYDWALHFDKMVREAAIAKDFDRLVHYEALGRDAVLAAPTPDHYIPLLYVLGCAHNEDQVSFPVEGFDGGSISMLSILFEVSPFARTVN